MTKNKDEFDENDDEFDKWDIILAYMFVIILVVGMLIAGVVLIGMAS